MNYNYRKLIYSNKFTKDDLENAAQKLGYRNSMQLIEEAILEKIEQSKADKVEHIK